MKLSFLCWLCLTAMFLFTAGNPVSAGIYKFTDESGTTRYTNDPGSVPREYRDNVDVEEEAMPGDRYEYYESDDPGDENPGDEQASEKGKQSAVDGSKSAELQARIKASEEIFKDLEKERERVNEAIRNSTTREEFDEANAAMQRYNQKYKDFMRRREALKKEVSEFNEQVRQKMRQELEAYDAKKKNRNNE